MTVKELYTYPVKSTRGTSLQSAEILRTGLRNDRCVAIIDEDNKVITGRERHELITISAKIYKNELFIFTEKAANFSFALPYEADITQVNLFRNKVSGKLFSKPASNWISKFLKGDYRLIFLDEEYNSLQKKRGGRDGERKGYADSAPVHLINLKTLNYLNSKLVSKVSERNFRPNIVIDGGEPFEEDTWSVIDINGCRFRLQERTKRCIFIAIDPERSKINRNMQPLTALAKLRFKMGLKPTIGVGLVPINTGVISTGNQVKIMKQLK